MQLSPREVKYAKRLLSNYENLGLSWLTSQKRIGVHSNMKLSFEGNSNWRASVHNLDPTTKTHTPSNCILEIFEMNVQQHTAIPDLFAAYRALWRAMATPVDPSRVASNVFRFKNNFARSPKLNGCLEKPGSQAYFDWLRAHHLKHIIRKSICRHLAKDEVLGGSNWYNTPTKRQELVHACVSKLCDKQKTLCFYSGCLMSFRNDWTRFSFERIDNKKPHFLPGNDLSNVVFVCRILNSSAGWNRKKLLTVLLSQKEVRLGAGVRLRYQNELKDLS